jgi:hypothetical protein
MSNGGKMKRLIAMLFCAGSFAYPQTSTPRTPAPPYKKLTLNVRWHMYIKSTYTDHWRHVRLLGEVAANDFAFGGIKNWGSGLSGYGKSLAPVYGQSVICNSLKFAAGALIGDDARYRPSTSRGLLKRSLHAAVSTFTARAGSGNIRPAYSRIFAVIGAWLIANQWQPLPKVGFSVADELVFNVTDMYQDNLLAEFSPDLKRFGRKLWHKTRKPKIPAHP